MRILFLEAFYGGSHREVADAIVEHSRHEVELLTLPARFWKWRMRGAALTFAERMRGRGPWDLIVSGGMMSFADLTALCPHPLPPTLLYAHETQLTYPAPNASDADLHFAFTDLTNMLTATSVLFNSETHRSSFFERLKPFLRKLPEHRPVWALEAIRAKARICYPGIRYESSTANDGEPLDNGVAGQAEIHDHRPAPLILWNHRWEFDKAPDTFFAALRAIKEAGVRFRLALLGENFQVAPQSFDRARKEFADEIVHYGFVPDRGEYTQWLRRADIVVSTAIQENFGISVMEAMAYGCVPLLPNRLSYPEILTDRYSEFLYEPDDSLPDRLADLVHRIGTEGWQVPESLAVHARTFAWKDRIREFDSVFDEVAGA